MAYSIRLWLEILGYFELLGSNPGPVGCLSSRLCITHIQCSILFEGLECAVISMALCTIKHP